MSIQRRAAEGPTPNYRSRTDARVGRRLGRAAAAVAAVAVLVVSSCGSDTPEASTSATTAAGGGGRASEPFDAATVNRFDGLVRQFQEVNQTPGVLVGVWSPQGTYVSASGVSDLTTNAPLDPDMQFKIASQTKAFTGNLILQLVGEGRVSLDDHISKWVAGVPNGDQITIRELLNMTSGLSTGFLLEEANQAQAGHRMHRSRRPRGRRGGAPSRSAWH